MLQPLGNTKFVFRSILKANTEGSLFLLVDGRSFAVIKKVFYPGIVPEERTLFLMPWSLCLSSFYNLFGNLPFSRKIFSVGGKFCIQLDKRQKGNKIKY